MKRSSTHGGARHEVELGLGSTAKGRRGARHEVGARHVGCSGAGGKLGSGHEPRSLEFGPSGPPVQVGQVRLAFGI
ncbi:hypothetical protein Drorol1_Dr00019353, partial [Drosera rotundifolia]